MVGFVPTQLEVAAPSVAEPPAYAAVQQTYGAYAASPVDAVSSDGAPLRREGEGGDPTAPEHRDPTREDDRWRP
jgi:hypothetical protein